jgi:hypothetical protein
LYDDINNARNCCVRTYLAFYDLLLLGKRFVSSQLAISASTFPLLLPATSCVQEEEEEEETILNQVNLLTAAKFGFSCESNLRHRDPQSPPGSMANAAQ